jgi:hypothetical protein
MLPTSAPEILGAFQKIVAARDAQSWKESEHVELEERHFFGASLNGYILIDCFAAVEAHLLYAQSSPSLLLPRFMPATTHPGQLYAHPNLNMKPMDAALYALPLSRSVGILDANLTRSPSRSSRRQVSVVKGSSNTAGASTIYSLTGTT